MGGREGKGKVKGRGRREGKGGREGKGRDPTLLFGQIEPCPKATDFGEITLRLGLLRRSRSSKSPSLVPIESSYAT